MNGMRTSIIFEHPLNEKIRMLLRLEYLLNQISESSSVINSVTAFALFRPIIDFLELTERTDLNTELNKELDRYLHKLIAWSGIPQVDSTRLQQTINQLKDIQSLLSCSPRISSILKEDKLISSVRQRINIPGGCCSFDLPALYLWLSRSQHERDQQVKQWTDSLAVAYNTLSFILSLTRQSGHFRTLNCNGNYFQDTNEIIELLRIRLPSDTINYPQISGNKSRFAIRFVPLYGGEHSNHNIVFDLACC